jgi:hemoglobin/transferrin/lactoferrin receptor protein
MVPVRLLAVLFCLIAPAASFAQAPPEQAPTPSTPAADTSQQDATAEPPQEARFFDTVTVSATLSPTVVRDTPGTVSVIDAETIQRRMIQNTADLVKFEPGVYVDANVTRLGLNGFNIRGVGGNRVMTRVDGVETSEQFDFGPFNVHQFALDLETLKSAEIVRSAGSSLYGSDALGGVVSMFTKDPADYLAGQASHIGGKLTFDGRSNDTAGSAILAVGGRRLQGSLFASYSNGAEMKNQGTNNTQDARRTTPNPQDRDGVQALGKVTMSFSPGNVLRGTVEIADTKVQTQAYSSSATTVTGPIVTDVTNVVSDDTMQRYRFSVDQSVDNRVGLNYLWWNLYAQNTDTNQILSELRSTTGAGVRSVIDRDGTLNYDQDTLGGALQARKVLMAGSQPLLATFGGSYKRDVFDMIRDRLDINTATGAVVPPTNIILPSKYFPKSTVGETGVFGQVQAQFGRVTLLPGVRYDYFTLDADEHDQVYIDNENPAAQDFSAGRASARFGASVQLTNVLSAHAQYAGGFRAPPYSAVNSGFTNLASGYTSLPNTDLRPETSDNFEASLRGATGRVSFGITGFSNYYDDFILQVSRGLNPATGLLEYQYENVSKVEIRGLELQGEARLAPTLRLRAAYTVIRGDDVSGEAEVPINTVGPDQGVVGLQWDSRSQRFGSELLVRAVAGQRQEVAGDGMFAPSRFASVDLTGWYQLAPALTVRAGVLNLTNAHYFEWPNVRGRSAADPAIDRYSSPGITGLVSLGYGW